MNRKIGITVLVAAALATGGIALAKDRHRDGHNGRGHARIDQMIEAFDLNKDGVLTQEEIDTARAQRLQQFDTNSDGNLSLEEYQALWLDAMHERMVDQFQRHDDDGNGLVTAEEFGEMQAKMVARMDRNDDGQIDANDMRHRGDGRRGRDRSDSGERSND
ncbi:EF-hand domain-containing protein [Halovulum sp. GXIMD14793]